jgi:8-oxo-dGTP pyrophosphatase MutT (NUDIX family)
MIGDQIRTLRGMEQFARLPVGFRRIIYRVAYALLCVYWFVRRPDSHGVKCVLIDGDRVLLVRHTYGRADWELPGGSIKSSEEPMAAARREIHEELGIDIDGWTSLGEIRGRMQYRHDIVHCFQAELREPALTLDLGELYEAAWFLRAGLPNPLGPYTQMILAQLA